MSKYSITDLNQLKKIMSTFQEDRDEESILNIEDDMMPMSDVDAESFLASLQQGMNNNELTIEQQIEESFILRTFTGRAALRLHGKSTSKQIFW